MTIYYVIAIGAVIISAFGQVFLKLGANHGKKTGRQIDVYLNPLSIIGYGIYVLVTLMSLYALQKLPLKELVFILPLMYILIPLFSRIFLGERVDKKRYLGFGIILVGIIVFNLDKFFS